jgi:hypothetical protein
VSCEFVGATKTGRYQINDWGPINREWVKLHLQHICGVLQYP